MTKEKRDTVFELQDKLMDYLDLVCDNEEQRQRYSVLIASNFIICSCPYDKKEDMTLINKQLINNRLEVLKELIFNKCEEVKKNQEQ